MKVLNTSETCPMTDCSQREECEFFAKRQGIKFNADARSEWCAGYTKEKRETTTMRKKIVEKIAEKCWLELEYDDVVNERTEEIDYELIVDCVLRCWREVFRECVGQ